MNKFNKGIFSTFIGSFWWGFIGVFYFKYISFINPMEVVSHRVLWTIFFLFVYIILKGRLNLILSTLRNKKKTVLLFFSGLLIFLNYHSLT